jgi:hypothetical protein
LAVSGDSARQASALQAEIARFIAEVKAA